MSQMIGKKRSARIVARVSEDERKRFYAGAAAEAREFSEFVRLAIEDRLKRSLEPRKKQRG